MKVVLGAPRPFSLGRLSNYFGCALLVGYHSRAGAEGGVPSHKVFLESVYRVTLNGVEVGEIGIIAALVSRLGALAKMITRAFVS